MGAIGIAGKRQGDMEVMYRLWWDCADCDAENELQLSKFEAAFLESANAATELRCKKCGSLNHESRTSELPEIDEEILDAWSSNNELCFSSEDEDMFMDGLQFSMLTRYYRSEKTTKLKRKALLAAIMIKVYDDDFILKTESQKAKNFLKSEKRNWLHDEYFHSYIVSGVLAKL